MTSREEWRRWLEANHLTSAEVWLVYYKKPSGKQRIPYSDAVEEALCFGWIDGKIKRINEDYYIQRFTPRRTGSRWSKYNLNRIQKLIDEGRMRPAGLKAYQKALDKPELVYGNKHDEDRGIPDDLLDALRNNTLAFDNFMNFSQSSRRIYLEWMQSARKDKTRQNRILRIVEFSEKNIRPGMM